MQQDFNQAALYTLFPLIQPIHESALIIRPLDNKFSSFSIILLFNPLTSGDSIGDFTYDFAPNPDKKLFSILWVGVLGGGGGGVHWK